MTNYEKVKDLDRLNELIEAENNNFFIILNFGARSSKHITFGEEDDTYCVYNEIDGTYQTLTKDELFDESLTLIGKAIKCGAFFSYGY